MYVPTIIIDNELSLKLHSGEVKLRPGQWIQLAWSDRKARFIGRNPDSGTLWVSHYPWDNAQAMFDSRSENMKKDFSA
jgi:hypothetical protein